jgi:3-oxo-5-alpha-steroid 4-dehydrogenase 1
MIMEFPAFFVIGYLVITHLPEAGVYGLFFLLMWESHYFYRVFVYPQLLTSPNKPFPLVLVAMAIIFNTINGAANGLMLVQKGVAFTAATWIADPRFWTGVLLFCIGFAIHAHSDKVLRMLRRRGNGDYLVTQQGLFRFVSSPNYLGEMVEWTGFAVATWSLAGSAFAVFTVANLLPRTVSNHRWYQENFPEYPKERKRLLPRVW